MQDDSPWTSILGPGEKLLWRGRPKAGLRVVPALLVSFAISCAGALFGGWSLKPALEGSGPLWTPRGIFGLFWVVIVFAGMLQSWMKVLDDNLCRYALTDRRALILGGLRKGKVRSWPITKTTPIVFTPGERSHLKFAVETAKDANGDTVSRTIGFNHLQDGETVHRLILQIQSEAK